MKKFLICLLCVLPMHAGATVLYRVQTDVVPTDSVAKNDTFASRHRFYVGGMYDISFWQNMKTYYINLLFSLLKWEQCN